VAKNLFFAVLIATPNFFVFSWLGVGVFTGYFI